MTPYRAALLLLAAACLVLAGSEGLARRTPSPTPESTVDSIEGVRRAFAERLREAESTARCALEEGADRAAAHCLSEVWADRLEGVAVIDGRGTWIEWAGAPTSPLLEAEGRETVWAFRSRGMRHSLVVRTGPAEDGRVGAAWFTLESSPDADATRIRIPGRILDAGRGTLSLQPAEGVAPQQDGSFPGPSIVLDDPGGRPLALLDVNDPRPGAYAARARAIGLGVAAILAALALAVASLAFRALSWFVPEVACVVTARAVLVAAGSFEALLPRTLGGPSLYGAPGWGGVFGSPAALFATAIAWFWLARIAVRAAETASSRSRRGSRVLLPVSAAASVFGLAWVSGGLARDGRVDVLALGDASSSLPHAALLAGLASMALATAFLLAASWTAWSGGRGMRAARWLSVIVAAAIASEAYLAAGNGITAERLQSEFGPLVAEQSARRRLALESHVAEVARSALARDLLSRPDDPADLSAGWVLWSGGPLGLRGWLSSIDVVADDGAVRARFAFGLPPLEEPRPSERESGVPDLVVREETIAFGASEQRLLHAEATIGDGHGRLGRVVAHVLDEPANLPFLPGVAPYLAALGSPTSAREAPDYVLYGADGRVVLSTLARPPARNRDWADAPQTSPVRRVRFGGSDYLALVIPRGERVHLLLAAAGGPIERAGGLARIALLQTLLLAVSAVGAALFGGALPWRAQGAFYRKILTAMLAASLLPLLGLALVLRTSIEGGAARGLQESSADIVGAVRRVVEDYAAVLRDDEADARVDDSILSWLRGIVGQEIHLYEDGVLAATSKPELFESGLLSTRLPGDVRESLLERGEPSVVRDEPFGDASLPVAYARADLAGTPAVVAVPLVLQRRAIGLAMERVLESLLLTTVLLGTLLATAAAWVARNVSRPVREMVDATGRVARGDYGLRLRARSRDELATLAEGFNSMTAALAAQRADLERRRDYMEALLRHATLGVVSTDAHGSVVTMNPAAAGLLKEAGASVKIGVGLAAALEPEPALRALTRLLTRPVPAQVEPEEIDLRIPDSPRRIRVVRVALPDPEGGPPGALILLDDVTELARSSQLAAWAEMARAIAHEIKNPLTPIQLSAEHLERLLRDRGAIPDADLEACLRAILGQVRALREIAGEFSTYAKLPDLVPEPTGISAFVREAMAPYRAALPAGISLDERYGSDRECAVDRRSMGRALANLVENALHAMPAGGTLRVSTGDDVSAGEAYLVIEDTGTGLSPEARVRLFEPYFSTKSSGTGLGLAIVLRTVEAHGGRVDVESEPGRGTSFRVSLPLWR